MLHVCYILASLAAEGSKDYAAFPRYKLEEGRTLSIHADSGSWYLTEPVVQGI